MGVIVISMGPSVLELYLCLIHLWEARTGSKGGALIGLELLIIDEQVTLIQAFIHHIVLHGTSFIFFSTQRKAKSYAATVFYKFTASVDNSRHPFSGDCESKSYRWLNSNPEIAKKVNA
ncbi:hypothetical protein YC2023_025848 [Brassica napus]